MESTLKQIGYMALSWCLRGFLQSVMRPIMIPKLVRMGKMHPEVARQNKPSWRAVAYWLVLTAAVAAFLAHSGVVRMTVFLVFTTLVLPLFRAVVFPRVFPVFPFLIAVSRGVALGGRPGALPRPRPLPGPPHHPRASSITTASASQPPRVSRVSPSPSPSPPSSSPSPSPTSPRVLELIVANRTEPQLAPYCARGWYYGLLSFATADGENPYRVRRAADGVRDADSKEVPTAVHQVPPG